MKEYKPSNEKQDENENRPVRRIKYKYHWGRAFFISIILLGFSFFLAFFALTSAGDLLGLEQPDKQIEITIKDNMSFNQITSLLSKSKVIEQPLAFSLYATLKNVKSKVVPGTYILNSNMMYDQIFYSITTKKNDKKTVKIQFMEGMTAKEMAAKLEEAKVCNAKDFLEAISKRTYDYDFISRIPDDTLRFRAMEGYLFPDTYEFFESMNVNSVVNKFLTNFETKLAEVDTAIKNSGMSLDKVITLASLIQHEATTEEMATVSSVFLNRLDAPETYPKLQSDVTIFYVEKNIKPYLNTQNQALYDAYNTYVCDGLPIAPICNPGLDAINAALNPAKTDYYFFLTDAKGKFYYAKTANEHYNNNYRASKIGQTHGILTQ